MNKIVAIVQAHWKTVVAVGGVLVMLLQEGQSGSIDWWGLGIAALAALGVYAVPNIKP